MSSWTPAICFEIKTNLIVKRSEKYMFSHLKKKVKEDWSFIIIVITCTYILSSCYSIALALFLWNYKKIFICFRGRTCQRSSFFKWTPCCIPTPSQHDSQGNQERSRLGCTVTWLLERLWPLCESYREECYSHCCPSIRPFTGKYTSLHAYNFSFFVVIQCNAIVQTTF